MIVESSRESAEPPTSSRTVMAPKPSAAALRSASTGKTSPSSHSRANGIISSRAKVRATAAKARCSSESSKSMRAAPAKPHNRWLNMLYAFRSAEHDRKRPGDRLMATKPTRLLDTEADYEAALAEIEQYFDKEPAPGTREAARFDLLALALEEYETKHWPIEPAAA